MTKATPHAELAAKLRDAAFTPKQIDAPALMDLLGEAASDAKQATRLIKKIQLLDAEIYLPHVWQAIDDPQYPSRHHAVRLLGQIIHAQQDQAIAQRLSPLLQAADPRLRRYTAQAITKLHTLPEALEEAMLQALSQETLPSNIGAILEGLGHAGTARSLAVVAAMTRPEAVSEAHATALRHLERKIRRHETAVIHHDRALGRTYTLRLFCRAGFEPYLAASLAAASVPHRVGAAHVDCVWDKPLAESARFRLWESLAFVFPLAADLAPEQAWLKLMHSPDFQHLFTSINEGWVRFRMQRGEGASRARLQDFAALLAKDASLARFINDPTEAVWEWHHESNQHGSELLLFPKRWQDLRFAYRVKQVPASSHPTVAAFLASLAPVDASHRIWDPFVGAGAELIERGLRGPYREMLGTDTDQQALQAAAANVAASGLNRIQWQQGDALAQKLTGIDGIITNPPLGRRVQHAPSLLLDFLAHAARVVRPGGYLIWVTPDANLTDPAARRAGWQCDLDVSFDLGGFHGRAQRWYLRGKTS